jgi:SAM-dependent methyltransferase
MPDERTSDTQRFSGLASGYATWRPGYPAAAIEAIVASLAPPIRAVDVGCGTGISTIALAAQCAQVIGLEPNDEMRGEARSRCADTAGIDLVPATAEATGLDDGSCDLVLCAQAFHWFEPATAHAEFRRILRPGGRLALAWNVRRSDTAFMRAYQDLVAEQRRLTGTAPHHTLENRRAALGDHEPGFERVRRLEIDNSHAIGEETLIGRALSASYFPRETTRRERIVAELRALFARHEVDATVTYRLVTELTLADRSP